MKKRDGNIELLRCVLMFLIVLWHCSMCSAATDSRVAKMLSSLPVFAVDAFVLISGWYGVSFSVKKVAKLLGLGLFSACVISALSLLSSSELSVRYSLGWFGCAYLGLMILSPILNAGLDKILEDGRCARMVLFAYTAIVFVSWLPLASFGVDVGIPGFGGMTLNTLMYVYVIGRFLRREPHLLNIGWRGWLVAFLLLEGLNIAFAILSGLTKEDGCINLLFSRWRVNDSPLAIAMAVAFIMFFLRLKIDGIVGRVAAYLAPSMFSVYLLHCGTNFDLTRVWIGRCMFLAGDGICVDVVAVMLVAVATFAICIAIDLTRRSITAFIRSKFTIDNNR